MSKRTSIRRRNRIAEGCVVQIWRRSWRRRVCSKSGELRRVRERERKKSLCSRLLAGHIAADQSRQLTDFCFLAKSATETSAEYEWNQNVEEVNLNVTCEVGLSAKKVKCIITTTHLQLKTSDGGGGGGGGGEGEGEGEVEGEGGDKVLLDHKTVGQVKPDESFWTIDSKRGVINITLQKSHEGKTWSSVFQGHETLDHQAKESEQRRLLLERFQLEHPGFDFSGAEINGAVPDASTFMGGFSNR